MGLAFALTVSNRPTLEAFHGLSISPAPLDNYLMLIPLVHAEKISSAHPAVNQMEYQVEVPVLARCG